MRDQFSYDNKLKELLFNLKRGKGHMISYFYNRVVWNFYAKLGITTHFPTHVDIEVSASCQLKCPMCYRHEIPGISGYMDFDLFKKIINELASEGAYSVRLSWRGEPLMNPKIKEMVKYAKQKKIKEVSMLTNSGVLTEDIMRTFIENQVDWITISIDGINETYEHIRYPLKFNETVAKIKKFKELKKEYNSVKPVIKIQSTSNAVQENLKEYYSLFNNLVDKTNIIPYKDYSKKDNLEHNRRFKCPQPFQRLVVASNGDVAQCICDVGMNNKIGDLKTESIKQIWQGSKMKDIRKLVRTSKKIRLKPCNECFNSFMESRGKQIKNQIR